MSAVTHAIDERGIGLKTVCRSHAINPWVNFGFKNPKQVTCTRCLKELKRRKREEKP